MTDLAEAISDLTDAVSGKVTELKSARGDLMSVATDMRHSLQTGELLESKEQRLYHEIFRQSLRDPVGNASLLNEAINDLHSKDVTITSLPGGGYALPKALVTRIGQFAYTNCPWLDPTILGPVPFGSSDVHAPVGLSDAASIRVTESATRTATSVGTLRDVVPKWGEYLGFVKISNWARADIPDLEDFLIREIGAQIGAQLAGDIVSGNGTGQVLGLLNTTPVTTADSASPIRAAAALQYVAMAGPTSPQRLLLSDIEALLGQFAESYLLEPSFAFIMRPSAWQKVLGSGRASGAQSVYSVDSAFVMPRNPTLYGFPVRFSTAVPAVAPGAYSILAGAWQRAYLLASRGPALMSLDEVTVAGYTNYRYRIRYGGCIRQNNAAKVIRT